MNSDATAQPNTHRPDEGLPKSRLTNGTQTVNPPPPSAVPVGRAEQDGANRPSDHSTPLAEQLAEHQLLKPWLGADAQEHLLEGIDRPTDWDRQAASGIGVGITGSEERSSHTMSTAAFWLGVLSIFIGGDVVAVPLAAALLGVLGLADADSKTYKNRWMAGVGLVPGSIYTLVYLHLHGHM